jgi:uncharacterized membrane protein (Fun14 family)
MTTAPTAQPPRSFLQWLRDMPRWQQILLGGAMTAVIVGGVLTLTHGPAPQPAAAGGTGNLTANAYLPGAMPLIGMEPQAEPTAKGVFRLGFSFVAGFCIGAFVRSMIKVASIAVGFWLVMTFALSFYGLLTVNWTGIEGLWNRFWANVGSEWGNFSQFMTGSLPAAGLAAFGLSIGLKKH